MAVPEVVQSPELVPAASGFYGWWSRRGALGAVPHISHPLDPNVALLYVGISPARETSRQTLRSRVVGNHLSGNVGSSTFRFVLAALLLDALELHPYVLRTKVALSASDNRRLSAWQREQLLLTWCARERPWEIESEVIAQLTPPLERLMARFPEDQAGNTALAQYQRGYNFWTRAQQLRDLARYFRDIGVVDQERLKQWALTSTFKNDFEGQVKRLGPAVR